MKRKDRIRKAKSLAALIRWKNKQPRYLVEIRLKDGSTTSLILSEEEVKKMHTTQFKT